MAERQSTLDLGVVGNCSIAALLDRQARYVWGCFPDFAGDPMFCRLLAGDHGESQRGFFDVELDDFASSEQRYVENSAIILTTLRDAHGGVLEVTDFAPRYKQMGRLFRPMALVRHIRAVSGRPRIRVRLRPAKEWGASAVETTRGSNHIRYIGTDVVLRCTTDLPVTYILEEVPFLIDRPVNILIGPDETLTTPIEETTRHFYQRTLDYWNEWSRYLSIPFEWQDEVIRAAITLKLSSYEETGAVMAAMTTSIPEAPDSQRNWDYRYCWIRDGYYVVRALNRLGATKTMEIYLQFLTNLIAGNDSVDLQPVYGIAYDRALAEEIVSTLSGYRGMGPVRRGNQAYQQPQNDVYGSVILAAAQMFFDTRLTKRGDEELFRYLEPLGERCLQLYNQPDAGLWELRRNSHVHTYSSVMCWAGADRLARIAAHLGIEDRARYWGDAAERLRGEILDNAYNQKRNSFVEAWNGDQLDGSLLLLLELGFVDEDDPRFAGTVDAIGAELKRGKYLMRYAKEDDFGAPENAFVICNFWYIDALVELGRTDEAREMFEDMLSRRNHLGLLSEDLDPETGELWGNFPQTYSMVGLINSAMLLSRPWKDAF